jgi:hypothetical protein
LINKGFSLFVLSEKWGMLILCSQFSKNATASITYRDSANYKYSFALQLTGEGMVLIVEPEWYQDEEEDKFLIN